MNQQLEKIYAMACVIRNSEGKILMLKRVATKKYIPNQWAVVGAAPLSSEDNPEKIAHREMVDEIGFDGQIEKRGEEIVMCLEENGETLEWHVFPFLASVDKAEVVLNAEHSEYQWMSVSEALALETSPIIRKIILNMTAIE
ncbi:NUDIX hydrolase [Patescibacteria group bacterium]|nr:MAG: NUDIX hydrolase [Patescibacteria group bacterium]